MTEQIIQDFLELVKTDASSKNERLVADKVTEKLKEIGCEVFEDKAGEAIDGNAGNIIARLQGSLNAPAVLFSAHMDRVKKGVGIKPIVLPDKIVSAGDTILAADNIAGVVSIIDGLRRIQASGKQFGDVEVVFSVSEEQGLLGSKHLDYNLLKAKIAYVLDSPGRFGRITNAAPAKNRIDIVITGRSAHAGNEPEKGINAIKVAAEALAKCPEGRINAHTTANFGIIEGGTATNVVCDRVILTGEVRSRVPENLTAYKNEVVRVFTETANAYQAKVDIDFVEYYDAFSIPETASINQYAKNAMLKLGYNPVFVAGGGGMDANRFNKAGINAVGISTGYQKNHTTDEEIYKEDLIQAGKLVEALILEVAHQVKE